MRGLRGVRLAATATLLGALAGCAGGGSASCSMYIATALPIVSPRGASEILVGAKLDGVALRLKLDTGAFATMLSASALRGTRSQNTIDATGMVTGIGGSRSVGIVDLKRLELGRLHGHGAALETGADFSDHGKLIAGLLGMSEMGTYDVDLNVLGGDVRLYSPKGDCSNPDAVLGSSLFVVPEVADRGESRQPRIQVGIDGKLFIAEIDTGSPGTVIMARAARQLGLNGTALAGDRAIVIGGVGTKTVKTYLHRLPVMTIGGLTFQNMLVGLPQQNLPDVDIILGMDFVYRVHVWISNSSGYLIMEFPPLPSPALPPGV